MFTEKEIRRSIREELRTIITLHSLKKLNEQSEEESISNSEFTKALKTSAADIAGSVPAKLNDDMALMIKTLTAMAQFDKSKFDKMKGYIEQAGVSALEKSSKGEKPKDEVVDESRQRTSKRRR